MASAILSDPKDISQYSPQSPQSQRRLSIQLDAPASASPFPSPSSSFIPPPTPGAHEFAIKPPPASAKGKRGSRGEGAIAPALGAGAEQKEKNVVETPITPRPISKSSFMAPPEEMEGELEPRTPTASIKSPASSRTASSSSEIPTPTPASPSTGPVSMSTEQDKAAARLDRQTTITIPPLDTSSIASLGPGSAGGLSTPLTSSRPAPPSPAVSRRASGAPSNSSGRSRSSRPPSTHIPASVTMTPHNRSTHLSQSSVASPVPGSPKKRRPLCVKVRDFAYPSSDERYLGLGPNTPKPNRVQVLNRFHRSRTVSGASRLSIGSLDKADFDDEEEGGDDEAEGGPDGWNGFKWGFGRLSTWGFGANGGGGPEGGDSGSASGSGGDFPSHTDFARNFGEEAIDSSSSASDDPDDYYSGEEGAEEEPLDPGLYRAMYAFDPEGTAEMRLEEDQIVRVVGRGGGVGWAVVVRHPPGKDVPEAAAADEAGFEMERHALVPESYLELVKLDSEDQDEEAKVGAET